MSGGGGEVDTVHRVCTKGLLSRRRRLRLCCLSTIDVRTALVGGGVQPLIGGWPRMEGHHGVLSGDGSLGVLAHRTNDALRTFSPLVALRPSPAYRAFTLPFTSFAPTLSNRQALVRR